jgi:DNA-binding XRE family transcriptional regulator
VDSGRFEEVCRRAHKKNSIWNILYGISLKNQGIFLVRKTKADFLEIGSRIRALRGDVSQEELAGYLRIRQGQLSKIERGKAAPSIEVLILLAERFQRSLDWILLGRIT